MITEQRKEYLKNYRVQNREHLRNYNFAYHHKTQRPKKRKRITSPYFKTNKVLGKKCGVPKGTKLSSERKKQISELQRKRGSWIGELNPTWNGGITSLRTKIRGHFKYRQWRSDIFTRDNFTCVLCGDNRGGILNADHYPKTFADIFYQYNIKSIEDALNCEEFWNINNGRTLCVPCHKIESRKKMKGNKFYLNRRP